MRSLLLHRGHRTPSGQRIETRKFLHAVSSANSLSNASIVCISVYPKANSGELRTPEYLQIPRAGLRVGTNSCAYISADCDDCQLPTNLPLKILRCRLQVTDALPETRVRTH